MEADVCGLRGEPPPSPSPTADRKVGPSALTQSQKMRYGASPEEAAET